LKFFIVEKTQLLFVSTKPVKLSDLDPPEKIPARAAHAGKFSGFLHVCLSVLKAAQQGLIFSLGPWPYLNLIFQQDSCALFLQPRAV